MFEILSIGILNIQDFVIWDFERNHHNGYHNKVKPCFVSIKVFGEKKKNYASFVLKLETKKKIFYTYTNNNLCL